MTELSKSSKIVVSNEVVSCDLDGETAMLNMENGVYYGLNPMGTRIWELIKKPITIQEIMNKILEEYEVDEDTCYDDLTELIEQMLENKLVEII